MSGTDTDGKNGFKNILLACLITGFVATVGGYTLKASEYPPTYTKQEIDLKIENIITQINFLQSGQMKIIVNQEVILQKLNMISRNNP